MSQDLSSDVNRLQSLVNDFTVDQMRYIAVRPFVKYDKDAAKEIGLAAETISRWANKAQVDEAVKLMALDGIVIAGEQRQRQAATTVYRGGVWEGAATVGTQRQRRRSNRAGRHRPRWNGLSYRASMATT